MVVSKTMTATVIFAASNKSIRGVGNGTRITKMLEISPKGRTKFCQPERRFMLANGVSVKKEWLTNADGVEALRIFKQGAKITETPPPRPAKIFEFPKSLLQNASNRV